METPPNKPTRVISQAIGIVIIFMAVIGLVYAPYYFSNSRPVTLLKYELFDIKIVEQYDEVWVWFYHPGVYYFDFHTYPEQRDFFDQPHPFDVIRYEVIFGEKLPQTHLRLDKERDDGRTLTIWVTDDTLPPTISNFASISETHVLFEGGI